jgi:hypothetical protein
MYADRKYFNPKKPYITIVYPIVVTQNKKVEKIINDKIKDEMYAVEPNEDIRKKLREEINVGLTDVSYEVTFKEKDILSFSIFTERSGGNHLVQDMHYFNFDLNSGEPIELSDLISNDKIDSFKTKVFHDRNDSIDRYKKEEIVSIKNNIIDSTDYKWILELLEEDNIVSKSFGETFVLSDSGIEIIEPIEFPSAIRSQEPSFHLKYSFSSLKSYLKPKYLFLSKSNSRRSITP